MPTHHERLALADQIVRHIVGAGIDIAPLNESLLADKCALLIAHIEGLARLSSGGMFFPEIVDGFGLLVMAKDVSAGAALPDMPDRLLDEDQRLLAGIFSRLANVTMASDDELHCHRLKTSDGFFFMFFRMAHREQIFAGASLAAASVSHTLH